MERLYSVEVEQIEEMENLQNQMKELEETFLVDKSVLNQKHLEEKHRWEKEIARLTQIIAKKKLVEEELTGSIEVNCKTSISINQSPLFFFSIYDHPMQMTGLNLRQK